MSYTKIHPIKIFLNDALDYIMDKNKTRDRLLISSFGCSPNTAHLEFRIQHEIAKQKVGDYYSKNNDALAQHLIQSFPPEEVTPEQAHEIGKELADQLFKGKYQYVITTHVDKWHVHNHIMINVTNLETHKKIRCGKNFPFLIWKENNKLCQKYNLTWQNPDEKTKEKGKKYYEWQQEKAGSSYKDQLKKAIDKAILTAKDYKNLLEILEQEGFTYNKRGSTVSFKKKGQKKATRLLTLGKDYSEERIAERIAELTNKKTKENLLQSVPEVANKKGYYNSQNEIKKLAATIAILQQNNICSFDIMEMKIAEVESSVEELKELLNQIDVQMANYNKLIDKLNLFNKLKPIMIAYEKAIIKKSYYAKHGKEIEMFLLLNTEFEAAGVDVGKISMPGVLIQKTKLLEKKNKIIKNYTAIKNQLYELNRTNNHVQQILKPETQQYEDKRNKIK